MAVIWHISDEYPEEAIGEYDRFVSPDRFLFLRGAQLESPQGLATFRFKVPASKLVAYECLPNNAMVPLVGPHIAQILELLCPGDIQLFPAHVYTADADLHDYRLLNATHCVKAVDRGQSAWVSILGTQAIMKFNRLRHLPDCMSGHHIARDADYHSHLLISETLHSELKKLRFRGIQFTQPEEIHP